MPRINIYNNAGTELLWSENVGVENQIADIHISYTPQQKPYDRAIFQAYSGPEGTLGNLTIYDYQGEGFFKGLAFEAFAKQVPEGLHNENDFSVDADGIDLYVVDNEPLVKARLYVEGEDQDTFIISIPQGQVGVLDCKGKYMLEDIKISNDLDVDVLVYLGAEQTSKSNIIGIPGESTAILECKEKLMPDDIYIRAGEPLEE